MFEFMKLRLQNFVLYKDLDLDLTPRSSGSTPQDSVLIRGHNEHGKTTLFRGLLWTVFGAEGLEKAEPLSARHAIRLQGLKGRQEHHGELVFRTDAIRYRIVRKAITEEDDKRIVEDVRVYRYSPTDPDDPWKEEPAVQKSLAELYFPPDLAPYLFLNADKVNRIIGDATNAGPGGSRTDEATQAINDMLGITAVKKAADRVGRQQKVIQAELSQKIGKDSRKEELESEVSRLEQEVQKQDSVRQSASDQIEALSIQAQAREEELRELEDRDDATAVYARRDNAQKLRDKAAATHRDAMKVLRQDFSAPELYLRFFQPQLDMAKERLAALHVEGVIPQTELPLLTKLLNSATNPGQRCICGETDIHPGTQAHARLKKIIEDSQDFEEGANRLDKIRSDLLELVKAHASHQRTWATSFAQHVTAVKESKNAVDEAQSALDDAEREVDEYEADATREQRRFLRKELDDIRDQLRITRTNHSVASAKLDGGQDCLKTDHGKGLVSALDGARRKLRSFYDTVKDAQPLLQAVEVAGIVGAVLAATIRSIQEDQVAAVSARMNQLFLTITNNGADVARDEEHGVTSVTSKVGIREVINGGGRFELYAETASGDVKPLGLLNGASRQALTVAFMVALLENSDAPIPMVTDSLFHPLSGSVKFRLVKHLLAPRVQKITFFTHDDVERPEVRRLLMEHAAHTYTISNSHKRSDLANPPVTDGSIAMICTCKPDEFCETCELADVDPDGRSTHSLRRNTSATRVL